MRPPKPFPPGSVQRLQQLLKTAATVAEQRRIQAVLIRALDASPPLRIAQVTGLSVNTVRVLHSRFLREGEAFLVDRPGRGGRRRALLDGAPTKGATRVSISPRRSARHPDSTAPGRGMGP